MLGIYRVYHHYHYHRHHRRRRLDIVVGRCQKLITLNLNIY